MQNPPGPPPNVPNQHPGFGGAHGAPQAFPPGAAGLAQPGPQQPQAAKSKAPLFIALGCGVLFFFGLIVVGVGFLIAQRSVEKYRTAVRAIGSASADTSGELPTTTSAPTGGAGTCAEAASCCEKIMAKSGAPASNCAAFRASYMPPASCEQALTTYRQSAKLLGVRCN